jgi:hypothetical protein
VEDVHVEEDDARPPLLGQASVGGYVAVGPRARRPVRRVQKLGGREVALPPRTGTCDGYNLNAGVSVKASDREGLERLCRVSWWRSWRRSCLLRGQTRSSAGGVLAGNAAWRREVIPKPKAEPAAVDAERRSRRLTRTLRVKAEGERPSWSDLLLRVFGVDGYRCPGCAGRLVCGRSS